MTESGDAPEKEKAPALKTDAVQAAPAPRSTNSVATETAPVEDDRTTVNSVSII